MLFLYNGEVPEVLLRPGRTADSGNRGGRIKQLSWGAVPAHPFYPVTPIGLWSPLRRVTHEFL